MWERGLILLRINSGNWRWNNLRDNTRSELVLPIAPPTLQILRDYLEQDRLRQDSVDPELFLRLRCPNGSLRRTAVGDIFDKRMREAGLQKGVHGAYSLRHAFAMRLLARGVGVKAIGDLLGHRSLESTCNYLRLDVEALRDVALEIPGIGVSNGGSHDNA